MSSLSFRHQPVLMEALSGMLRPGTIDEVRIVSEYVPHGCSWTIMEAEAYLQYVEGVARERSQKQWVVDLSWLDPLGIQVPDTHNVRSLS